MMKMTYQIQGMHCASCVEKIKKALTPVASFVEVTLNPPRAELILKREMSLEELNAQMASAGDYRLIPSRESHDEHHEEKQLSGFKTYYPLFLIVAYITLVSLVSAFAHEGPKWHLWMNDFMAGFFLVFSGFKLLDLRGFADAYATYDLLAKRWRAYGFIYPFLELGLGLAYLTQKQPSMLFIATIILMGFSSLGVIKALLAKQKIRCACLGTILNLPMTMITLVEDLAMVIMAVIMLIYAA